MIKKSIFFLLLAIYANAIERTFYLFYESKKSNTNTKLDILFRKHGLPTVTIDTAKTTIADLIKLIKEHSIHKDFTVKKIFYIDTKNEKIGDRYEIIYFYSALDATEIQTTGVEEIGELLTNDKITVQVE